jgi:hypothetical protein
MTDSPSVSAVNYETVLLHFQKKYSSETDLLRKRHQAMLYAYVLFAFRHDTKSVSDSNDLIATLRSLGEEYAKPISMLALEGREANRIALRSYRIAAGLLWQIRGRVFDKYERHRSLAVVDSLIRWGLPHATTEELVVRFRELSVEWSIVLGDFERAKRIARVL